jgi:threonine dehydrogenase-like Zn-dependent dehydrogenase
MVHLVKADLIGAGQLIAIDVLSERLELARACGAGLVLDATATSAGERLAAVREVAGAFVDMGSVSIDPNRDVCIKDVTILGVGGEDLAHYAPSLRLLERHPERFAPLITHRVGLAEVGGALELAQTGVAMKVLVAPNGGGLG